MRDHVDVYRYVYIDVYIPFNEEGMMSLGCNLANVE